MSDSLFSGVELPAPSGSLYINSGLSSIVGADINPLARDKWYARRAEVTSERSRVLTGAHPQLASWISALAGWDPNWSVKQPAASEWPFSRVIPRVKPGGHFPDWPISQGTYWFDYPAITGSLRKLPSTSWSMELASRLPEGSFSLLGGLGTIAQRMNMWRMRDELFASDFVRQFDAIVCPDFSSYLDDPRPQALIGERMTQIWASEASAAGLPVIPILSWQDEDALIRQVDALGSQYPQVHTVYVELLARGVNRVAWMRSRLKDLETYCAHLPVRWLFSGVDSGWIIGELRRIFPAGNWHSVTLWPWMRTGFNPGLIDQKSRHFRKSVASIEQWAQGRNLPDAPPDPQSHSVLEWQDEFISVPDPELDSE